MTEEHSRRPYSQILGYFTTSKIAAFTCEGYSLTARFPNSHSYLLFYNSIQFSKLQLLLFSTVIINIFCLVPLLIPWLTTYA